MKGHTLPGINQRQSPAKDLEQNKSYTHPHLTPSEEGGVHTDKHGNTTGGPGQSKKSPAKQRSKTRKREGDVVTIHPSTSVEWDQDSRELDTNPHYKDLSEREKVAILKAQSKMRDKGEGIVYTNKEGKVIPQKTVTESPNKWVQFIPAALSALGSMSKKDEKDKEE
tara:strand:+ start:51 stop:551 length:501 start_codon:yes stop_codon:yes gene_type:complete